MDLEDTAVVAVRPQPALVQGDLKAEIERPVLAWVKLNSAALVEHWEGRLDTVEPAHRLVRLQG